MPKPLLSLALAILLSCSALQAQDSAYARKIIAALSSSQMHGRGAELGGDTLAARFLQGEMRRLGLQPLADNYLQPYTYPIVTLQGRLRLRIGLRTLKPYTEYRVVSARHAAEGLAHAAWKRQVGGVWVFSVDQLHTYGPIRPGREGEEPVCVEVLGSALPRLFRHVSLDLPARLVHHRTQNVCGLLPGQSDSLIVFTAHYDHCGMMGSEVTFPGAHDNASGTAAVLDLARHYSQRKQRPPYTLAFLLFSGEEAGLQGSRHAAEHPLFDLSKVKLLCNIDMFCGGDDGILFFNAESDNTKPYFNRLQQLNARSRAAKEIRPRKNSPNSDHYPFSSRCPAIFLLTMGGPYGGYHDPADTCQACGLAHYQEFMRLILQLAE